MEKLIKLNNNSKGFNQIKRNNNKINTNRWEIRM